MITFSGIDCAGKSTQIDLLAAVLGEGRRAPVRFWHRPGYSKELDLLRRTTRRLVPRLLPRATDGAARARAFARPAVKQSWAKLAIADGMLQYGVKLRALGLSGRPVLCDRYVWDARIDLALRFPDLKVPAWRSFRALEAVSPDPAVSFLLMLDRAEMLRRMECKREPFPDAPALRDARYRSYIDLADSGRFIVLDGGESAERVHQRVLEHVLAAMPSLRPATAGLNGPLSGARVGGSPI